PDLGARPYLEPAAPAGVASPPEHVVEVGHAMGDAVHRAPSRVRGFGASIEQRHDTIRADRHRFAESLALVAFREDANDLEEVAQVDPAAGGIHRAVEDDVGVAVVEV